MTDDAATNRAHAPYVAMALTCERVLREKDDVLTIVRIVDSFQLRGALPEGLTDDADVKVGARFFLVIGLKSGGLVGTYQLALDLRPPSSPGRRIAERPVVFESESVGVNVIVEMTLAHVGDGTYWIDVAIDEQPLTSIPIRLTWRTEESETPSAPSGGDDLA